MPVHGQEPRRVLECQLRTQGGCESLGAERGEVGVEVVPVRREHEGLDAVRIGPRAQHLRRPASDPIVVAGNIEPPQPGRRVEPCQVRRRQGRDDGQCRQDDTE